MNVFVFLWFSRDTTSLEKLKKLFNLFPTQKNFFFLMICKLFLVYFLDLNLKLKPPSTKSIKFNVLQSGLMLLKNVVAQYFSPFYPTKLKNPRFQHKLFCLTFILWRDQNLWNQDLWHRQGIWTSNQPIKFYIFSIILWG